MKQVLELMWFRIGSRACERISEFAIWWTTELFLSVPFAIRRRLARQHEKFLVRVEGDTVQTRRLDGPDESWNAVSGPEAAPHLKPGSIAVLLPAGMVLRRVIELPLAATASLHETASFQVGRITPFKLEEVRHITRVLSRDQAKKTIRVEIAVVRRAALEGMLARVDAHRIEPSAVYVDGDTSQPALDFLPQCGGRYKPRTKVARTPILAGALALLLALPFVAAHQIHVLAEASQAEAAAAAKVAHRASAAQTQLDMLITTEAFLPDRLRSPQAIETLDALTQLIPDTTWIFRLEIRAGEAMLSGFSSDLPALLQKLAMPPFAAPELTSPVVQGLTGGQTRFDLRVQYRASP